MRCAALVATILASALSASAMSSEYTIGSLQIISPWSRATPKGSVTAVGYLTIKNNGTTLDRLIDGTAEFAGSFQLHSMSMADGISKMRQLKSVDIAPGQTVEFKPGGSHIMFVGLKHPLAEGEGAKGTLVFEHAGTVQIEYAVEGIGAQAPHGAEPMSH